MIASVRMVQRNALVYRRIWRGSLIFSFVQPTLYLVAMGLGVGTLVNRGDTSMLGGVPFLHFLAPGLLAAACMQTASFESAYPITDKMTWHRNYHAISATPMRVADLVIGELAWIALRVSTVALAFCAVMAAFRIPRSFFVLLAIPAGALIALAFGAPIMAYAATRKSGGSFNTLFRFVITPLFLFSGVFFPIDRLPRALQTVAHFTPLFHGVELVRGLTLNTITASTVIVHLAYLLALMVVGIGASLKTFRSKLQS